MEAKDTIIPVGSHSESIWCPHCGEEFGIESKVEYERETQAEVSFKAGIKEVVEFLFKPAEKGRTPPACEFEWGYSIVIQKEEWQAKVKEWEVE